MVQNYINTHFSLNRSGLSHLTQVFRDKYDYRIIKTQIDPTVIPNCAYNQ